MISDHSFVSVNYKPGAVVIITWAV